MNHGQEEKIGRKSIPLPQQVLNKGLLKFHTVPPTNIGGDLKAVQEWHIPFTISDSFVYCFLHFVNERKCGKSMYKSFHRVLAREASIIHYHWERTGDREEALFLLKGDCTWMVVNNVQGGSMALLAIISHWCLHYANWSILNWPQYLCCQWFPSAMAGLASFT